MAPSYQHPGVYIEELPGGARPIEGVATSVAAFVGAAPGGATGEAVPIASFEDYKTAFADIASESDAMGLAVQAFYSNGGKRAYICNLGDPPATPATATAPGEAADSESLTVTAIAPGAAGNDLVLRIVKADPADDSFTVRIGSGAGTAFSASEEFPGVNMMAGDPGNAVAAINAGSTLVTAEAVGDGSVVPRDGDSELAGGGDPGLPSAAVYETFFGSVLRKVRDANVLVLPGADWGSQKSIVEKAVAHCEAMRDRMLLIDPPAGSELDQETDVTDLALPTSTYTTLYYPWVRVANPFFNADTNPTAAETINVAPSAFAAGMWNRIDSRRGVWKAPAGVETGLTGVASLEYRVEDSDQDSLNPLGVNCLRNIPGYGPVIWGARTLATNAKPEWRYLPVRRTALFIEKSIYNGIQWAVFEPNDHPLWSSLRAGIGGFMNGLFRGGAFQGATANDAYFVRCGLGDTMTQADIDRGQVIVTVGFAPLKPAEFVIVRIQQKVARQ